MPIWRWAPWCWRSPAAKRCMPTWDTSAAARSSGPGWLTFSLPLPQLPRPGRADPRRPGRGEESILPAGPDMLLYPNGGAGHGGHCDRLAGGNLRRLFAHQPGHATRLLPAHPGQIHLGARKGQIYMPNINWLLLLAVIALVLGFKSSSNLASAYGIAVTLTMMIDTLLAFVVVRALWNWNWLRPACSCPVLRCRFRLFLRQSGQGARRRLVPAVAGPLHIYPVRHLEARPHPALPKAGAGLDAARRLPCQPASTAARTASPAPVSS
jgi:hypothetical protein